MRFFENLKEVMRDPKYWLPAPPPAPPIPMWISNWIWDIIAPHKEVAIGSERIITKPST